MNSWHDADFDKAFAACESIRAKKVFPIIDFLLTNKLPAQPNIRAVQNEVSLYFYF